MRNLRFTLYEVLDGLKLAEYPFHQDYNKDTYEMALDAAKQIGDNLLFPIYEEMDRNKPKYENGTIKVHPKVREIMETFGEGGWINGPKEFDKGGQQMPYLLFNMAAMVFHAANTAAAAFPYLTAGAANLIDTFGSQELIDTYVPNMWAGKWQGTMCLTEPQAGSSLSDITSSATPVSDGVYKIKGQKIYISAGDHDGVDNIVHLYLAKIDGAPAGVKGISLFVVPKFRPENGELVDNNVTTAGAYGKMGIKGAPIAHIITGEQGDTLGYLVGEPHKGLSYMFRMMNEARIGVGQISAGLASGAYYASLQYANERPQGRPVSNKDVNLPQSLIIEYADVKRMLLQQKAVVEGSIHLIGKCSLLADLERLEEGDAKETAHLMLELLTPICKSYPAEYSIASISNGLQVLGGAGFCDDFPLQQYYRDTRINPIYEGTTGIQAMDLLGRKVTMKGGKAVMLFNGVVNDTIEEAKKYEALKPYAEQLSKSQEKLVATTMHLMQLAQTETPEVFLADASLYLDFFSLFTLGWLWLEQGIATQKGLAENPGGDELNFYKGKMATLDYFYEYELPKTFFHARKLTGSSRLTLEVPGEYLV